MALSSHSHLFYQSFLNQGDDDDEATSASLVGAETPYT